MKRSRKYLLLTICILIFTSGHLIAQEEKTDKEEKKTEKTTKKPAGKESSSKVSKKPDVIIKVYGFGKFDYKYASRATTFFGTEGVRKPNAAKRQTESDDSHTRSAFQANQTRIGVKVKLGKKATAAIETDFDNSHGTDNTAVSDYLRLRQAYIIYRFTPSLEIFAGKKWDIFSPLVPKTFNVTSILFGAGNVGWIRDQAGIHIKKKGDSNQFGLKAAIGNIGKDGGAGPKNTLVYNKSPLGIMQLYYKHKKVFSLYLSGIGGSVLYKNADLESTNTLDDPLQDITSLNPTDNTLLMPSKVRSFAGGVSLGMMYNIADKIKLTAEFQKGTNLGDLYALGNSKMTSKTEAARFNDTLLSVYNTSELTTLKNYMLWTDYQSTHETSGWICLGFKMNSRVNINVFLGASIIDNPEYLSSASGDLTVSGGATTSGDVQEAHLYGTNISYKLMDNLLVYVEYNYLKTRYHESERTKGEIANITSINPTTGAITIDVKNPIIKNQIENTIPNVTVTENKYNFYNDYQRANPLARAHLINLGIMLKF